jgi:hypothetical protein
MSHTTLTEPFDADPSAAAAPPRVQNAGNPFARTEEKKNPNDQRDDELDRIITTRTGPMHASILSMEERCRHRLSALDLITSTSITPAGSSNSSEQ